MKVLAVGAYANGNVGDAYQADAIATLVHRVDEKIAVSSLSPSRRKSPYSTIGHDKVSQDRLYDFDFINSFDLVLVGGGGLLAAPHHPLNDPVWAQGLKTTVCGLALGVAANHALESRAFVERCDLFSVRDEFSFAAVKAIRSDVDIIMDPILLEGGAIEVAPEAERRGIAWVPGKLVPGTVPFYEDLLANSFDPRADVILSFNPETDLGSGFEDVFGGKVTYLQTLEQFNAAISTRRYVVSERYHGCIIALRAGLPALGLILRSETVTSKISELYRRTGLETGLIKSSPPLRRSSVRTQGETVAADIGRVRSYLAFEHTRMLGYLEKCIARAASGS